MTVSIPIEARPDAALSAFNKIADAARRANVELKRMSDLDLLPGLDDAKRQIQDVQHGLEQMFSKAVRGTAAESLRSGRRAGFYDADAVSWFQNVGRQFPDPAAAQKHTQAVLAQAGRIASFQPIVPGMPGGPTAPAGGGGWGMSGMLPMMRGMLPLLGVGTGLGFLGKKVGDATDEAIAMSDLRRQVSGINEDFIRFRDRIRESSDAMGVGTIETVRLNREYARLSGSMGSAVTGAGANEGMKLARMFGLDVGQGVGMMGRAGWLGMGGGNVNEQARILAEAMAGSNLGGRQADAAEAMLRFAERSAHFLQGPGNVEGFKGLLMALYNADPIKAPGIRANAETILGGYDSAIRSGGMAGDAGKNFMWNVLSKHGVRDPFHMQYALEGGFTGDLGGGRMIGPELIQSIRSRYGGGSKYMMLSAISGLFGGSMHHAEGALTAFDKYEKSGDRKGLEAEIARIKDDMLKGDPGTRARIEANELEKELTESVDGLIDVITDLKKVLSDDIIPAMKTVADAVTDLRKWATERQPGINVTAGDEMAVVDKLGGPGVFGGGRKTPGVNKITGGPWGITQGNGITPFDLKVDELAKRYGIAYSRSKDQETGLNQYMVTSGTAQNSEAFVRALDRFAESVNAGIVIHLEVDPSGRVHIPSATGNGRVPPPVFGGRR